jgi:hypothetical protein
MPAQLNTAPIDRPMPALRPGLALVGCLLCHAAVGDVGTKHILGWVEPVLLTEAAVPMEAKLDTGAETSSLDTRDVRRFRRDGERMVRFVVDDPATGLELTLERPLVRTVRIKRHDGDHQTRAVVRLSVCLGTLEKTVEFTLVDRGLFRYPVLLGRNFLAGDVLVDAEIDHVSRPLCEAGS